MRNTQYFHHLFSTSLSLWFLSKFFFFFSTLLCFFRLSLHHLPILSASYVAENYFSDFWCLSWFAPLLKSRRFFFFFLEDDVYLTVPCVAFSLFFIRGAKEWIFLKEGRWKEGLGWDERAWNERGRCQLKQWTPLHPPLDRWGEWSWQPSH